VYCVSYYKEVSNIETEKQAFEKNRLVSKL
jgi:hypothetical protein